jgi:hypothetical protein
LVNHFFDRYPVPKFMPAIWLSLHDQPWERNLYLYLARGLSVRKFLWPIPVHLTKAAAAFFMQAPDDLAPLLAVRWAHVRSLGGDNRLARLLLRTNGLTLLTLHEEFWESVIRFLIKNAPISAEEVIAIVDFIHDQRFRPGRLVWGPKAGDEPLQPQFSLRGRSLRSLRRHMANWRTELMIKRPDLTVGSPKWSPTPIRPFRHEDANGLWCIDELLTDRELRVEGGIMQHCVATYIPDCARRLTSIWSMKLQQGETRKRVLTIEVLPETKTIWQARGKRNLPPNEVAQEILGRWAQQEGLGGLGV